jgi:antitoxin component of MazEF toxin-antitoxin module
MKKSDGKIKSWGNSAGVLLPKDILEEAQMAINDTVEIYTYGNRINILPTEKKNKKVQLANLQDFFDFAETLDVPDTSPKTDQQVLIEALEEKHG